MKEVMCGYQAAQILQTIDKHVHDKADAKYNRDKKGASTAPAEFMEDMTAVCVEDAVKDIQSGRFKKPGVSGYGNTTLKNVWRQLGFQGDADKALTKFMPAPDELLSELEGYGVISRAEPERIAPIQNEPGRTTQRELGRTTWVVNAVTSWMNWLAPS